MSELKLRPPKRPLPNRTGLGSELVRCHEPVSRIVSNRNGGIIAREYEVSEPPLSQKITVAAGVVVSSSALLWLWMPRNVPRVFPRIGFLCAITCAEAVLAFCWGASFAFLTRKRRWSPRKFLGAGILFMTPGVLLEWLASPQSYLWFVGSSLFTIGLLSSFVARKLALPGLTPQQIFTPEPPLSILQR